MHWSNAGYERIARLARDRAALTFPENRREITEAAIGRAMAHVGQNDLASFAALAAVDSDVFNVVLTEITVGETYFFRDPAQWELLRTIIAPDIINRRDGSAGVRAWSAGCASGEEAYTLSIALKDAGCVAPRVFGTDLCEHRLARASRGVYTKWSMRGMDPSKRESYFRESGQYFHLLPQYRDVRFSALNLAGQGYAESGQELYALDLILCRNVLIYIDPSMIDAIFARLVDALVEGGWLMVAASDPQPSQDLPLDVIVTESGLLFRKNSSLNRGVLAAPARVEERQVSTPFANSQQQPTRRPSEPRRRTRRTPLRGVPVIPLAAGDAAQIVASVREQANRGQIAEALATVAAGLMRHEDVAELHILRSVLEAERGNFDASAEAARRALYLDRSLVVAQVALSTALVRRNDLVAADRVLRAAEKALGTLPPLQEVAAGDGATAASLLNIVRAHRHFLEQRGVRAR